MPLLSTLSKLGWWTNQSRRQDLQDANTENESRTLNTTQDTPLHGWGKRLIAGKSTGGQATPADVSSSVADMGDNQGFTGWSSDENWVWAKLHNQGDEPLMPELWQWDFPSFPDNLFSKVEVEGLISNIQTPITEAVTEFAHLVDNGPRCRDALSQGQHVEPVLVTGLERYLEWAYRDGGLQDKPYLELIVICSAKAGESASSVVNRASQRMRQAGQQWRERLQQEVSLVQESAAPVVPTIFAFVIKYSVVSVLSYDACLAQKPIRTLAQLNHLLDGFDVWHAFTVGIMSVYTRDRLMQMEARGIFGKLLQSVEDVDA